MKLDCHRKKYIKMLLDRYNMFGCKSVLTHIEYGIKLQNPEKVSEEEMKKFPFRSLIGALVYLSSATRPDIAYAVHSLSQFNNCYEEQHWKTAKRTLRYLNGTVSSALAYKKTKTPLIGYTYSD